MNFMTPVYAPPNSAATLRRASSAPIHKRSMLDPSRLSFANRRSESDKDLLGSLVPLGVVFMEQITISVDVAKDSHSDVRYELRVHHLKNNATWSFVRTFDEYRRFQQRLLKALDHGHFCNAECPWLYTFLKSYFPKKHLFNFATSRVISSRKDGLQRFFVSLQSFLLNRANHNCSFIANNVVDVVVEFVYGDYAKYYQIDGNTSEIQRAGSFSTKVPRASEFARCPEDDEASVGSAGSSSGATTCQLCESSLDGEAYASIRSYASGTTSESSGVPSTASSTSLMDDDSFFDTSDIGAMSSSAPAAFTGLSGNQARRVTHYVMTLGCGHQFHDECIVPKLNETLRCPTCDHLEVK